MEFRQVPLVVCGHKHTYTCTFPLREYYKYGTKNSKDNGIMTMTNSLENDNITFIDGTKDLTTSSPVPKSVGIVEQRSLFPTMFIYSK